MEFSSWPESFSRNQIHEAFDQELIHYQQLSDTLSDLFCVSQNNEAELGTSYSGSNYASEVYANASSIMCNYNVNNISHVHKNTTCSSNSLDRLDDKKMVKTVKPVKKKRGCYTRKNLWTSSKITSWTDDGHAWRKYGQKEIQNAKHKRNYYRCIYKFDQGCKATKQVQKIEDDPTNFKITYHQHHTCKNFLGTHEIILDSRDVHDTSILLSFESNRLIDNKKLDQQLTQKKEKEQQDCFSSLPVSDNQSIRVDYNRSHDLTKLLPFEPISLTSPGLEHDYSIFSGVSSPIYEIGHMFETIDFNGFPIHFPFC
ncbi:WRKY domain-containing protein [Tanacetum coccineum]